MNLSLGDLSAFWTRVGFYGRGETGPSGPIPSARVDPYPSLDGEAWRRRMLESAPPVAFASAPDDDSTTRAFPSRRV
jgi:hypothetical protein